jgi:hypothetical protein
MGAAVGLIAMAASTGVRLEIDRAIANNGNAVDHQAEQIRATEVVPRIHHPLAEIELGEVEIGDHIALTDLERLADDPPFRIDDRGKEAGGVRSNSTTGILHNLGLLVGHLVASKTKQADSSAW